MRMTAPTSPISPPPRTTTTAGARTDRRTGGDGTAEPAGTGRAEGAGKASKAAKGKAAESAGKTTEEAAPKATSRRWSRAVHHEHRAGGVLGAGSTDRAEQQAGEAAMTAAAHDQHPGPAADRQQDLRGAALPDRDLQPRWPLLTEHLL